MNTESKFDQALLNPTSCYDCPVDLVRDPDLNAAQKLEVLRAWEAEADHLQESEAEGFAGGERSLLDEIKKAELWINKWGQSKGTG